MPRWFAEHPQDMRNSSNWDSLNGVRHDFSLQVGEKQIQRRADKVSCARVTIEISNSNFGIYDTSV